VHRLSQDHSERPHVGWETTATPESALLAGGESTFASSAHSPGSQVALAVATPWFLAIIELTTKASGLNLIGMPTTFDLFVVGFFPFFFVFLLFVPFFFFTVISLCGQCRHYLLFAERPSHRMWNSVKTLDAHGRCLLNFFGIRPSHLRGKPHQQLLVLLVCTAQQSAKLS
jgi:hypothetical protein